MQEKKLQPVPTQKAATKICLGVRIYLFIYFFNITEFGFDTILEKEDQNLDLG